MCLVDGCLKRSKLLKPQTNAAAEIKTTLSDDTVRSPEHFPPTVLGRGKSCVSLKAFMLFQKFWSSRCLQSESSLKCEVSGRERWRFRAGAKAIDEAEARAL